MIQRIQSLWLLLAAIATGLMVFFSVYSYGQQMGDVTVAGRIKVNDHYLSLVFVVLAALLSTIAVFFFKNRKQQLQLIAVTLVCLVAVIGICLYRVQLVGAQSGITDRSYGIGALLPVMSIVFLVMATIGIRKDDKLVKSMDRLR